jgi:hypothetical protein
VKFPTVSAYVSSVVIFVLTFKVLGLLQGFAAVYEPTQGNKSESIILLPDSITIVNTTQSVESGNNTKESNTTSNFSKK